MATPKQIAYLESLNEQTHAAGDPGIAEDVLARLSDLSHDEVQHWIGYLQDRLPATDKQLRIIFDFVGGLGNIAPDVEAEIRAYRRHVAHEYVQRILNDPHSKKRISEARWENERRKRDEMLRVRAEQAVKNATDRRAAWEAERTALLARPTPATTEAVLDLEPEADDFSDILLNL